MSLGASEAETAAPWSECHSPMMQATPRDSPRKFGLPVVRQATPRTPEIFTSRSLISDMPQSPEGSVRLCFGPEMCQQPFQSVAECLPSARPGTDARTRVQRHVVRIGLRLQCRIADLLQVGARLESVGYSSREHFQALSEEAARALGVPRHLAEALRKDSCQSLQRRPGRAAFGFPEHHAEPGAGYKEGMGPCQPPPLTAANGPATPRSSFGGRRRPASGSEFGSLQNYLARVESARELRHDGFDMRISNVRRDPSPCRGQQVLKSRSKSPVLGTSRDRCLAGAALWTRMKEVTSDIAPTYIGGPTAPEYERDYGWGSELSSPRTPHRRTACAQA